ncbi:replication factor C subunit 1 [Diachasma alloeum]|uniref:replication factor C subunit 1 n=1 Tax=Diachasma alloeum TaxID=454923 RepID=UPI00073814DF|nr:replication factor C subunit 1 [Diachasma alloeum]
MSKDIRCYFTKSPRGQTSKNDAKPRNVKKRAVISSDEEDDIKIADCKKNEKSIKKMLIRKQILSDSEDDSAVTSKKNSSSSIKKIDKEEEREIKRVDISTMLGKTPVKRVNVPKKESLPDNENKKKSDLQYNDDDDEDVDFEESLNKLDIKAIEANYYKEGIQENNTSGKRKKDPNSEDDDTSTKKPKLQKNAADGGDDHLKEEKAQNSRMKNVSPKISPNNATKSHESNSSKKLKFHNVKAVGSKITSTSNIEINREEKKIKKKAASEEEEVTFLEERAMKKKQSSVLYQAYLARGGARNPGSKPIPEGAPNCLAGLSFVLTGVFESLEREEASDLIKKYGGRVTAGISKKINYIVVGEEAGQSKLAKAIALKIKQISEDELLDLIRKKPPGNSRDIIHNKERKKDKSPEYSKVSPEKCPSSPKSKSISPKQPQEELKIMEDSKYFSNAEALVEKYRPTTMKQIIGQHGESSNAKKLYNWLLNWHKNRSSNVKHTKPSLYAKNDNGGYYKACLLSGPPGVGKTTSVQVVCKELGFDLLEFNASDTRSKKLLKDEVSGLLSNTTMKGYFTGNAEEKPSCKHVLLMDEVDGMAGNEDRGGLQELIALIKSTDIPIVCICNDRNNPKMRTLANYVFDLRFQKPRVEQIRGAMKSLCCKENIKISNEDLNRLIEATNQDIRQVINHLAMLIGDTDSIIKENQSDKSSKLNKDLKLGPWEVVRKVFNAEDHKSMTIHDKSDLFFHDYNIAGLFVQENYLSVIPKAPNNQLLDIVAASADSLSLGDQVEKAIRSQMAWSLLPMQACYSSVIPGTLMSGRIASQINFPTWLGKNSRRNKFDRLLQEITAHTRLVTGASKEAINMDYLKSLRNAITMPLVVEGAEGVEHSLEIMNHYHLLREDLDSIIEISLWPGDHDPMQSIESKVKAAFTRAYNKHSAPVPFVVKAIVSKKKGQATQDDGFIDDDEDNDNDDDANINEDSDAENNSLDVDKMIKAKKPITSKAIASTSKSQMKPASKRGRGRGK